MQKRAQILLLLLMCLSAGGYILNTGTDRDILACGKTTGTKRLEGLFPFPI